MPTIPDGVAGAVITGWGTALPPKVLTNDDLAGMMDTSDEWIQERTGIKERRVGGTTAGLSVGGRAQGARDVRASTRPASTAWSWPPPPPTARSRPPPRPCRTSSACAAAPST